MKYLFIGGPADGQRRTVDEAHPTHYIHTPCATPFSEAHWGDAEMRDWIYHRYRFGQSTVYLYTRLTPSEAMEILIRRYPQPL